MSIPHPATDPATPENIAARLRATVRRLTRKRVAAELRHQAEWQKRDELIEEMRDAEDLEALLAFGRAIIQAQGYVDETEAALVTARGNEETADLALRDFSRKVWA